MATHDTHDESTRTEASRPNRLIHETSPYLLQHAHNPVDWYPWGAEALARARREDKPIFLSIGYSACHWCHVMERECFENRAIADLMNGLFVNIKVDREERPDIDEIYMKAVTAMTGAGGWPMSVFLTPELAPFFGATYLPPVRAYGRPSFPDVLGGLAEAYRTQREDVFAQGEQLRQLIAAEGQVDARGELEAKTVLDRSLARMQQRFDAEWGGFGDAPKFPHAGELRLGLRHWQRTGDELALRIVTHTLDHMSAGGLFDQLGGGFHRYSVDREFRVPHFEKMLYDNAQLIPAYLEAHVATGNPEYAEVARACCEWVLSEMQTVAGGFASSQDADSEGEEGRFFVFTRAELDAVLGKELARIAAVVFDVRDEGNFEHGKNVLWRPGSAALCAETLGISPVELASKTAEAKAMLRAARERRVRPGTDDKVLVSWNGLMISALAQAYQVLGEPRYLHAAERAAIFVLETMRKADGRLHATARGERAQHDACLDDYAFMIAALLDLYESSFDAEHVRQALALTEIVEAGFVDRERGGYFTTGESHEALIARLKSVHDNALPAGSGVHAQNLLRLFELTGRAELRQRATSAMHSLGALASQHPHAFAHLMLALDYIERRPRAVVVAGDETHASTQALLRCVRAHFSPQRVVLLARGPGSASSAEDSTLFPLLDGKVSGKDAALAYVCRDFTCLAPVADASALASALSA